MANQPKTPLVAFRYARKAELNARAAELGVTVTALVSGAVDTVLDDPSSGVEVHLDKGVIHPVR